MASRADAERDLLAVSRLRLSVLIVLGAVTFFLPLDARYAEPSVFRRLLMVYAISAGLALCAFATTYARWGVPRAERIAFALMAAVAVNTSVYLYLSPQYPALVAHALTGLMMTGPLLFAWGTRRVIVVCGIALVSFAVAGAAAPSDRVIGAPPVFAFGELALGSAIAVASARMLSQMRARLARRHVELASLSARLMSVQEEERRRLSHELHEELGQSLTAVMSDLWLIERQLPPESGALRDHAAAARHLVAETLGQMRTLSQLLRPSVLDDYGLVPSLESQTRAFAARHQIDADFSADGLPERLPADMETAVYRIAQEALANVARHARASRVQVALVTEEADVLLRVRDDGVGLNGHAGNGGTGLIAIRERVRALGGSMVLSSPGGTCLEVRLPRARPALGD